MFVQPSALRGQAGDRLPLQGNRHFYPPVASCGSAYTRHMFDEHLHPRGTHGRFTTKGSGKVTSEKPLRPEQKAKIREILAEQAPEAARQQAEHMSLIQGRRPSPRFHASRAAEHEADIHVARREHVLPGGGNLDAAMEQALARKAQARVAEHEAAFEQFQQNLHQAGSPAVRRRRS